MRLEKKREKERSTSQSFFVGKKKQRLSGSPSHGMHDKTVLFVRERAMQEAWHISRLGRRRKERKNLAKFLCSQKDV